VQFVPSQSDLDTLTGSDRQKKQDEVEVNVK
jgi:hypothetical protein